MSTVGALARALGLTLDSLAGQPRPLAPTLVHSVFCYDRLADLVSTVVPFVIDGVARDEAVAVITPRTKLRALRTALGDAADGVEMHESESWYSSPIDAEARYRTMTDRFLGEGRPWIRIVGEQIWTARTRAHPEAWARYESLLNVTFANLPVTVMCAYDRRSAPAAALADSHLIHPTLVDAGGLRTNADYVDPVHFLVERNGRG